MAAKRTPASQRQSFLLTVTPIDFSLTDGTNIPAPTYTPPRTPEAAPAISSLTTANQSPTQTTSTMPGAFPVSGTTTPTRDTLRSPISPTSPPTRPSFSDNRPIGVRRLFSLNSLRQSFSSSRTSLSPALYDSSGSPIDPNYRPPSSAQSTYSTFAPTTRSSTPTARRGKRASGWFKRKSGLWRMDGDTGLLDSVDEGVEARESKRLKEESAARSYLPEVGALAGGRLDDGDLGWDEGIFRKA